MSDSIKPVPDGFHTITPYIVLKDAPKAIDFYVKVFDAIEKFRLTDQDGHVRHCEMDLGTSKLFITDVALAPETKIPSGDDTCPVWLYLYVDDPDALFDRAIAAGADVVTPMGDQPWGDRYGCLCDPFGYRWAIASRKENLTLDELEERMQKAFSQG